MTNGRAISPPPQLGGGGLGACSHRKVLNNMNILKISDAQHCFLAFCREDFRDLEGLKPSEDAVNARLTTPAVATMLNTDNIAFTR